MCGLASCFTVYDLPIVHTQSGFLLPRHLQLALRGKPLGLLATIASVPKLTHLTKYVSYPSATALVVCSLFSLWRSFFLDGATAALLSEDQRLPESTGVPSATVDSRDERSEEELIKVQSLRRAAHPTHAERVHDGFHARHTMRQPPNGRSARMT